MVPACGIGDYEVLAAIIGVWLGWRSTSLASRAGHSRELRPERFALSLQLVGRPFAEAMLYRVVQCYEDPTGWTKHHPPELAD
jgi:hypothetical protein